MKHPALNIDSGAFSLESGRVLEVLEERYSVLTDFGPMVVDRAVSCLVAPEPGDRVLLGLDQEAEGFILAVLERPTPGRQTNLTFPGNVSLTAPQGGLEMKAAEKISLSAPDLSMNAERGRASIGRLTFLGQKVSARLETFKVVGRAMDAVFKRVVQSLGTSYRYVEEHDELQAGSARRLIDGALVIQTENTVHTAEENIKLDAEQIHLA